MNEQKTQQKHTPGPWDVEYDNADSSGGGQWYNAGPAKVWFPYNVKKQEEDEALANARLIAAAPDQHEANKTSLLVLCALLDACVWHPNMRKDIEFAIEANRAAILKATGEQP